MKLLAFAVLCIAATVANARHTNPSNFILNGEEAVSRPFFAYLEIFPGPNFDGPEMFFGGGTLITTTLVLTVAQNVAGFASWRVGLGSNIISSMTWFNSISARVHENYNPTRLTDNIAILQLTTATPNNPLIGPATLVPQNAPAPTEGAEVVAYGFGFGVLDHQPNVLQRVQLTVRSQEYCEERYPHLHHGHTGHLDRHFCATNIGSSLICAGDQGGPVQDPGSTLVLGIQSFYRQADCSNIEAQPSAFIRISPYVFWIQSVVAAVYDDGSFFV